MLVAIPSDTPGGLDALISDHFGHCAAFTLVQITNGQVGEVTVLPNGDHEQGDGLAPVQMLKERDWLDIPIVYTSGKRAILAIEKGPPGQRAFEEAFRAWGE